MARSVATIYNTAVTQYVANAVAAGITPAPNPAAWSMYNYQSLIFWVMAFCQNLLEQIQDSFTADVENIIAAGSPQSFGWFQAMMLAFQFDATVPQIIQFNTITFAPYYPVVNKSMQVIAYCSVQPGDEVTTLIKVAGNNGSGAPMDLNTITGAVEAAQSYANTLGVPGIIYTVTSGPADRLFMQLDVYYNGLYSAVIQANVTTAINAYMQTQNAANPNGIAFNGVLTLSNLEAAIKAVPGVIDMVWGAVRARANTTAVSAGTNIMTATYASSMAVITNTQIERNWQTVAGYIIPEDTAGYALTDYRNQTTLMGAKNLNLVSQ